jgi:hypothetical protein
MAQQIEIGFQTFVSDGGEEFGAVRDIARDGKTLVVYVENSGDFTVPVAAVSAVHAKKVVFDRKKLDAQLLRAIGRAHDAETE